LQASAGDCSGGASLIAQLGAGDDVLRLHVVGFAAVAHERTSCWAVAAHADG
jgi:hypothetical protein